MPRIRTIREQIEDAVEEAVTQLGRASAADVAALVEPRWATPASAQANIGRALRSLVAAGRITRVRRGVYAAPGETQ